MVVDICGSDGEQRLLAGERIGARLAFTISRRIYSVTSSPCRNGAIGVAGPLRPDRSKTRFEQRGLLLRYRGIGNRHKKQRQACYHPGVRQNFEPHYPRRISGLTQGRYQTSYSAKIALRHGEKAPIARRVFAASLGAFICLLMFLSAATCVSADELYASDGVDLRWDNTLRYTTAARISARDPTILANPNSDDGDRDFAPGIVSNRLDLMSQLDLAQGDLGVHVSAAAWYDSVYHANTDNKSEATTNVTAVPSTRFAPGVRNLYGQYAELNDAFLYDTVDVGDIPFSLRAGRQTVLWGESLFYDPNSIASAQAPTDYTRTATGESSYSSNVYLPVTQLVLAAQLLPDVALTIYDQVEARASRQAGDGSYLSYVDFIGAGAGRLFLSSGQYLVLDNDGKVSANGQYGAALHASISGADFGFYALKFNARDPQIIETITPDSRESPDRRLLPAGFPKGHHALWRQRQHGAG